MVVFKSPTALRQLKVRKLSCQASQEKNAPLWCFFLAPASKTPARLTCRIRMAERYFFSRKNREPVPRPNFLTKKFESRANPSWDVGLETECDGTSRDRRNFSPEKYL